MDRVCSLRNIPTQHRGTNFCTSSARFAPSFVRQPNGPEWTQIVRNTPNVSLGSDGVDRVHSLRKIPTRPRGTNFCTNSTRFAPSFVRQQTVPNAPNLYEMHRNMSLGSNGVDQLRSLTKNLMPPRGTNFCISLARFVTQPNGPKCTKII